MNLLCREAVGVDAVEKAHTRTEEHGSQSDAELVDETCFEVLQDGVATPCDPHVAVARGLTGLCEGTIDAVVGIAGGAVAWALTSGLYYALIIAGALVCAARVIVVPEDRAAWGLVAAGLVAWAVADIYREVALAGLAQPPYPSPADAGGLAIHPTRYAAIFMLAGRGRRRPTPGLWLDGAIAALGASALVAAALFGPILETVTEGRTAVVLANLAYPAGDLLLLATVGVVSDCVPGGPTGC